MDESRFKKFCCVAGGLEEFINVRPDSLKCMRESLELLLALTSNNDLSVSSVDVKTALL